MTQETDFTPEDVVERTCGNCRLWGFNFYQKLHSLPVNKTCCADVVMDLPASFIPNRQTMETHEGEGCICWQPLVSQGDNQCLSM